MRFSLFSVFLLSTAAAAHGASPWLSTDEAEPSSNVGAHNHNLPSTKGSSKIDTVYKSTGVIRASHHHSFDKKGSDEGAKDDVVGDSNSNNNDKNNKAGDGDGIVKGIVKGAGYHGLSPVYEYYSSALKDSLYTLKKEELEARSTGGPTVQAESWKYRGIAFLVSRKRMAGQNPLYVYFNLAKGDHVLTSDINKFGIDGSRGYRPRGTMGYVWPSKPEAGVDSDAQPVYEYFDEKRGDHVYSVNHRLDMDAHDPRSLSYKFVGTAFFTHASPFASVHTDGAPKVHKIVSDDPIPVPDPDMPLKHPVSFNWSNAADAVRKMPPRKVYRYRSSFDQDSIITTNKEILGDGAGGWKLDGAIAEAYPGDVFGTVPLFRYFNSRTRAHFYTTEGVTPREEYGWSYLGAEAFVFKNKPKDPKIKTVALTRLFNAASGSYFWAVESDDTSALEASGYIREKVICYMLALGSAEEIAAKKRAAPGGHPGAETVPVEEGDHFKRATTGPDHPSDIVKKDETASTSTTSATSTTTSTSAAAAAASTTKTASSSSSSSSSSSTKPVVARKPEADGDVPPPPPKDVPKEETPGETEAEKTVEKAEHDLPAIPKGLPEMPNDIKIPKGSGDVGLPPPPPTLSQVGTKVRSKKQTARAASNNNNNKINNAKKGINSKVDSLEKQAEAALKNIALQK